MLNPIVIQDEEAEWQELMAAMMKKRLGVDDDDISDRKEKQKDPSEYMKQLTGLTQQPVDQPSEETSAEQDTSAAKGKRTVEFQFPHSFPSSHNIFYFSRKLRNR